MESFKTKTKIKKNHKVQIDDVPFDDGQEVEIIITVRNKNDDDYKLKDSLKGSVVKYDNPYDPVLTSDDWKLLK